jgi:hypothetical protein
MVYIIRRFSIYERQQTVTKMNISDAFKLTVLRFLNTAGVLLIVNNDSTQWYNGANLVYDVTVLLMIITLNPLW